MSFGERLRALRKATGKKQSEVGAEMTAQFPHVGMTQARLSYHEKMDKAPRQEILECFASYYDVPIAAFFEDDLYSSSDKDIYERGYRDGYQRGLLDAIKQISKLSDDTA